MIGKVEKVPAVAVGVVDWNDDSSSRWMKALVKFATLQATRRAVIFNSGVRRDYTKKAD
jgi:hypothetical protein